MIRVYDVDTKLDAKGETKRTQVTVDFTGASEELVQGLAARTLIVTAQGGFRRNGVIPPKHTVLVREAGTRQAFVATPDSLAAKASVMTPAERAALIKKLQELK